MLSRIGRFIGRMTLAQRFMLASLVILITGMAGIGWWIGEQIQTSVIRRTAGTVALYVNTIISPRLQSLADQQTLSPADTAALDQLVTDTELGQQIVAFKVWGKGNVVVYSSSPSIVGKAFPPDEGLRQAWHGDVSAEISDLDEPENVVERQQWGRLLEAYMPVRLRETNQVIAVAEYYQSLTDLEREIGEARMRSWFIVGGATLVMYLLLAGFVRRASNTIASQQSELNRQVETLTELLAQNKDLSERVRRAAAGTTALNERFLRRVSADLHDGPAQDLGLALLRLDRVIQLNEEGQVADGNGRQAGEDLEMIQNSLQHAMMEVRSISAGLGLPELGELSVAETVTKAVRAHERRTGSKVSVTQEELPKQAPLPVKITLYRLLQEALNNAYRHAGGAGQQVRVSASGEQLTAEISDQGPGFSGKVPPSDDPQLGLAGMRERVESLGGRVKIESNPGQGTSVRAVIPLQVAVSAGEQNGHYEYGN